jgi:hypothetical protein
MAVQDLYQNDELLADRLCDQYTINPKYQRSPSNPNSEFELFSDRHVRLWPTYVYDNLGVMRPTEKTPTINYDELKSILLSTDIGKSS